jgi:hypothetical protein
MEDDYRSTSALSFCTIFVDKIVRKRRARTLSY